MTLPESNGTWQKYVLGPIVLFVLSVLFSAVKRAGWFDVSRFTPHGMCMAWQPNIIWMHAASDGLIATSYVIIPLFLLKSGIRRAFPSSLVTWFAVFILGCGATHAMDVANLWTNFYWFDGLLRAITAIASVGTVVQLLIMLNRYKIEEMIQERFGSLPADKKEE